MDIIQLLQFSYYQTKSGLEVYPAEVGILRLFMIIRLEEFAPRYYNIKFALIACTVVFNLTYKIDFLANLVTQSKFSLTFNLWFFHQSCKWTMLHCA